MKSPYFLNTPRSLKDRNQTDVTLSVEDADCCKIDQMTANFALKIEKDSTKFEQEKNVLRLKDLNDEERVNIENLIKKNVDLFNIPGEFLDHTNAVEHKISTVDDQPVFTRQYRFSSAHKDEILKQVGELIEGKIVEPSNSPYSSPLWIVPKKADSQGKSRWRMVIDYRNLNEKTIGDAYPLPNITEILDQLGSAKYFSVFDLASGFHQIRMKPSDAHKTAFSTPFGHYQFNRMPFGLKNAPATFQRMMDRILCGLQGTELFVYLDDIVIYASSLQEHETKFKNLAMRLQEANLKLQPDKCEFLRKEVAYLGHVISEDGVRPDPKKIFSLQNYPRPTSQTKIKQFLGLAGYYRRFVENFSGIAKPLTQLLKKEAIFKWNQVQENAFVTLRDALCKEPVLQYPDFNKPFIITTDASNIAIGGVPSQGKIGSDKPISYASRTLSKAEVNYSTIEKELLAIIYCVSHFRPYVYGREFTLVTDHKPLVWLDSVKDPANRLVHWRLKLANYEYKIVYKPGRANSNADALSRNPPAVKIIHPDKPDPIVMPVRFDATECSSDSDDSKQKSTSGSDVALRFRLRPRPKRAREHRSDSDSDLVPQTRPRRKPRVSDNTQEHPEPQPGNSPPVKIGKPARDIDKAICADPRGTSETNAVSEANKKLSDTESRDNASETTDEPNSDSDSNSDLLDRESVPGERKENMLNIKETRDRLTMRKDNLVFFVTLKGQPVDEGAEDLALADRLPNLRNLNLARASVRVEKAKHLIALPIKADLRAIAHIDDIIESIQSLRNVITELGLASISIARTNKIDNSPWEEVQTHLVNVLSNLPTTLTICNQLTQIPPEAERRNIIQENHDSLIGGHEGVTKTYKRIREKFFWENMKTHVQEYIQLCRGCQLKKLVRVKTKQPMVITDTPGAAFDKISMDIVGPLPITEGGNQYILTIQDLLTKYSLAIPLQRTSAIDVADAFTKQFISRFGAPKGLLTDLGTNFTSSLMKALARKFKIREYRTTAYHPQTNGSIERSHHVLTEYLKQYVDGHHEWDEFIEMAMFSYNTSQHEGTGFTPFELVFGKLARQPSAYRPTEEHPETTYAGYLENLFNKIHGCQELAAENLRAAKERSKQYYDRRANPQNFGIGSKVLMLKEPNTGKFCDQYTEPCEVLEILSGGNVRIKYKGKDKVVHTNKLRLTNLSK